MGVREEKGQREAETLQLLVMDSRGAVKLWGSVQAGHPQLSFQDAPVILDALSTHLGWKLSEHPEAQ